MFCGFSLIKEKFNGWSSEVEKSAIRINIDTTDPSTWNWAAPFSDGVKQKNAFKYYIAHYKDCMDCVLSGYDNQGNLVTQERLYAGSGFIAEKCVTSFNLECAPYSRGDFSGVEEYVGDGSDI